MADAGSSPFETGAVVPMRRDVLVVRGPEAVAFLQGQLSQEVEGLAIGSSAPSLLLQPTGKVDAWLQVTRRADDELLLDVDEGFGEAVRARLARFKLRTKVELEAATWDAVAVRGTAAGVEVPDGAVARPSGWTSGGVDVLGATVPQVGRSLPEASSGDLEALRIEDGVPAMGAEITEDTIPAELGQWLIDASVSFTKGCYTGQELVARIDSRGGQVPRPVRGLVVDGGVPAVGAEVRASGEVVGRVTSASHSGRLGSVALAPIARKVAVGTSVEIDGRVAEVRELPLR